MVGNENSGQNYISAILLKFIHIVPIMGCACCRAVFLLVLFCIIN